LTILFTATMLTTSIELYHLTSKRKRNLK
jgi:hypothetical protein